MTIGSPPSRSLKHGSGSSGIEPHRLSVAICVRATWWLASMVTIGMEVAIVHILQCCSASPLATPTSPPPTAVITVTNNVIHIVVVVMLGGDVGATLPSVQQWIIHATVETALILEPTRTPVLAAFTCSRVGGSGNAILLITTDGAVEIRLTGLWSVAVKEGTRLPRRMTSRAWILAGAEARRLCLVPVMVVATRELRMRTIAISVGEADDHWFHVLLL